MIQNGWEPGRVQAVICPIQPNMSCIYVEHRETDSWRVRGHSLVDDGKPTGDGGGGGGCRGVCRESFGREYLGWGDASMAFERSWLRVLEVAKDRRRRGSGSGYGMIAVVLSWCD